MKLPIKLGIEPLVDHLFEMRFKARLPTSSLIPGVLYSQLPGQNSITRLPAADLPEQLRMADANLVYAPLIRVEWSDKYAILVGDRSIVVSCKLPYRGWSNFKPSIIEVIELAKSTGAVEAVERCSIKATNILPSAVGGPGEVMQAKLSVGTYDLMDHNFHVRVEIQKSELLHIIQLASGATAKLPTGEVKQGALVDTDTLLVLPDVPMSEFAGSLSTTLELLHNGNKEMFFSFIEDQALEKMEPQYG